MLPGLLWRGRMALAIALLSAAIGACGGSSSTDASPPSSETGNDRECPAGAGGSNSGCTSSPDNEHDSGEAGAPNLGDDVGLAGAAGGLASGEVPSIPFESEVRSSILFDTASVELREDEAATGLLNDLVLLMTQNPRVTLLRIEVHTDYAGPEEENLQLSGERALAIKQWLVEHGVASARLLAVGFGESAPAASNDTPAGMAKNRRIEFHIAELDGRPYLGRDPTGGGVVFG